LGEGFIIHFRFGVGNAKLYHFPYVFNYFPCLFWSGIDT